MTMKIIIILALAGLLLLSGCFEEPVIFIDEEYDNTYTRPDLTREESERACALLGGEFFKNWRDKWVCVIEEVEFIEEPICVSSTEVNVTNFESGVISVGCEYYEVSGFLKAHYWEHGGDVAACPHTLVDSRIEIENFEKACLSGKLAELGTTTCKYFEYRETFTEQKQFCECWSDEPCAEELVK